MTGRLPLTGRSLVGKPTDNSSDASSGHLSHSRDHHYAFANINNTSKLSSATALVLLLCALLNYFSTFIFYSLHFSSSSLFSTALTHFKLIGSLLCILVMYYFTSILHLYRDVLDFMKKMKSLSFLCANFLKRPCQNLAYLLSDSSFLGK